MPALDITQDASTIGRALRTRRKALGVPMTAAAQAAGISRVTWYRLECGAATVALGSLLAAARVLGLRLCTEDVAAAPPPQLPAAALPLRIRVRDFPQLQRLAWQMDAAVAVLAPREALGLYQRNWRHVDTAAIGAAERALILALRTVFGGDWPGV